MRFIIVDPSQRECGSIDCKDLTEAKKVAGLEGVDFGRLTELEEGWYINLVLYEFALCEDMSARGGWWCLCPSALFGGKAVLFATDEAGNTIDIPAEIDDSVLTRFITWMPSIKSVEMAISVGLIQRPVIKVDHRIIDTWSEGKFAKDGLRGAAQRNVLETKRVVICAACHEEFEPDWSEEEALAERERNFGKHLKEEDFALVCDDCYKKIMDHAGHEIL